MIQTEKVLPTLIKLHLDDLNILIDGLEALVREIKRNPTYNTLEKRYAISQAWGRLGALDDLYTLIIGDDQEAEPQYHLETAGNTVTR